MSSHKTGFNVSSERWGVPRGTLGGRGGVPDLQRALAGNRLCLHTINDVVVFPSGEETQTLYEGVSTCLCSTSSQPKEEH